MRCDRCNAQILVIAGYGHNDKTDQNFCQICLTELSQAPLPSYDLGLFLACTREHRKKENQPHTSEP